MTLNQFSSTLTLLGWKLTHHNVINSFRCKKDGFFYKVVVLLDGKDIVLVKSTHPNFNHTKYIPLRDSRFDSFEEALKTITEL